MEFGFTPCLNLVDSLHCFDNLFSLLAIVALNDVSTSFEVEAGILMLAYDDGSCEKNDKESRKT